MLTVYGIKQCDTCRKGLKWLAERGVEHRFHDFRADGLPGELVTAWLKTPFADSLVNRRSTTWRRLSDDQKSSRGEAIAGLLLEHPTLIKRPVFVQDDVIVAVGFNTTELEGL